MAKKKPLVVLTHPLHTQKKKELLDPHVRTCFAKNRSDFFKMLSRADALITTVTDRVTEKELSHAPFLKVIGNCGVGFNNIDIEVCRQRGIAVTFTPDVLNRATAELTLALLLAAARRLPEGERMCRSGKFKGFKPDLLLGRELLGQHAVIVGKGRIGSVVGELFSALGLRVRFINSSTPPVRVEELLGQAQVLSLHVPLTAQTHHWLDKRKLTLLPRDCIVLNTSRGPVVDEKALIQTLKRRRIYAAGLDVYENEPHIPLALRALPNVVLLPHLGSATEKTRSEMARLTFEGVLAVLKGVRPSNWVSSSGWLDQTLTRG